MREDTGRRPAPRLAIIVPCRNEEEALPATDSALRTLIDGMESRGSEPGSPQIIQSMPKGSRNHKENPCLQYRIFEIPYYCGTFEAVYLFADPFDL